MTAPPSPDHAHGAKPLGEQLKSHKTELVVGGLTAAVGAFFYLRSKKSSTTTTPTGPPASVTYLPSTAAAGGDVGSASATPYGGAIGGVPAPVGGTTAKAGGAAGTGTPAPVAAPTPLVTTFKGLSKRQQATLDAHGSSGAYGAPQPASAGGSRLPGIFLPNAPTVPGATTRGGVTYYQNPHG